MYCQVWWPILEIGALHLTHPSAHTQQWVVNTHTVNTHLDQWAAIAIIDKLKNIYTIKHIFLLMWHYFFWKIHWEEQVSKHYQFEARLIIYKAVLKHS